MVRRRRKNRRMIAPEVGGYSYTMKPETKRGLVVIFLVTIGVISILSFYNLAGTLGVYLTKYLGLGFGQGAFLFPFILIILAYFLLFPSKYTVKPTTFIGLGLFILSFYALWHLFIPLEEAKSAAQAGQGGGYAGLFLSYILLNIMGQWASLVLLVALLIASFLIMLDTTVTHLVENSRVLSGLGSLFGRIFRREPHIRGIDYKEEEDYENEVRAEGRRKKGEAEEGAEESEKKRFLFARKKIEEPNIINTEPKKPLLFIRPTPRINIDLPFDLLNGRIGKPTSGDIKANQAVIQKTLENFGIEVEMGEVQVGPTVTQYTLKPAEGVKLSQITTLHNDLALALAAHPIRIEAPIPGRSLVGIEVPNQKVAIVPLREILSSTSFAERKSNLLIALGKDVAGRPWLADLDRMPHLLIAGATGSGKTVCINALIVSLLYQNNPADLKFILVDPKRVELPLYNGIPHLLTPVITDVPKTVNALKWCIGEMERRFELLSKMGKRNIQTYNRDIAENLPYIVVIIDELADLMVAAPQEIEGGIVRLAQMARAVGIHLILATQRPSVDIITGLIKANITSRIAFSVASLVDSRTILDMSGAEKLLGRGDMLYMSAELSKPKRLQGAYVADEEITRIVAYLKEKAVPEYNEEVTAKPATNSNNGFLGDLEGGDELLAEAKEVVIQAGKASASLLQRRLRVGYARAARLLDLLEEQGIVGPLDGAKPREVMAGRGPSIDSSDSGASEEEYIEEAGEEDPSAVQSEVEGVEPGEGEEEGEK